MFMPETRGTHPIEAARHHAEMAGEVLEEALQKARIRLHEIRIISFSQGLGLRLCLQTGATAALALASCLRVPLVRVNHCVAHIEIGKPITGARVPLARYISCGSIIVAAFEAGRYWVFGETLDIALGDCLDVFAREAGLYQKIGALFSALVGKLAARRKIFVSLPCTVKVMDLSFNGLLTATIELLHRGEYHLEDLCYSLQEVAFSMLSEVTERALGHTEKSELFLLAGGVAVNKRLQSMLETIAKENNARFCVVPKRYALDNGAMIAWTGVLDYQHDILTPIEKSFVRLKWRLDEVYAPWVGG